ncbi:MAG: hypothetical protein K0R17_771 [Rariglobus sp.]|nr:hypothetical protein [Rariglobus sp.]
MQAPVVLVVTQNPSLTNAVTEFLHHSKGDVSVIWLTSVADACRRLAWNAASMVIVDDSGEVGADDKGLAALQVAAPNARVLVLAEDAVRS